MKQVSETEMLHKMAAYCSAAERCIQDVEKKLAATDLPSEARKRIIKRLTDEKYIDETRFAGFYANDKLRFNKWGRIRISFELQKKRIPDAIRFEAIENLDQEVYISTLRSILKNKLKTTKGKDKRDVYYKLLRFAAGRGFESSEINKCLKDLLNNTDYEEYTD
ncbi:MAG: RecX family transcriptional regulator [Tannerellaceae bacterium]|nr:RecX family transcriptional regulator [Tannerellaceae bacterium]